MRFPVSAGGSQQEFDSAWYIAQGFGNTTSYGKHEGVDINLNSGGDSDLGQELKAIANGRIIYYHYGTHPTTGFGRHLCYKIDGAWGTRWIHYSHCLDTDFKNAVQDVSEGQILARLGKSGTPYAHLHMSVFKVDPVTLPNKLDSIAHNETELNQNWEDPIAFIQQWMTAPAPIPAPVTDQSLYDFQGNIGIIELQRARSIMREYEQTIRSRDAEILSLTTKIQAAKNVLA